MEFIAQRSHMVGLMASRTLKGPGTTSGRDPSPSQTARAPFQHALHPRPSRPHRGASEGMEVPWILRVIFTWRRASFTRRT